MKKIYNNSISVKDIAKMAGVSVATVSRVINQNGRFSKETEERVKNIIEKYDYRPNQLARGLRVSQTKVVGILVPDITNEFFANITLELQKRLLKHDYLTLICNTNEMPELESKQISMLMAQQVSGIIYVAGNIDNNDVLNIPVVYIDRRPNGNGEEFQQVVIESDNWKGGYLATRELISRGCCQIACVSFRQEVSAHAKRVQGYRDAMRKMEMREMIYIVDHVNPEEGMRALKNLRENNGEIDGVFFTADNLAVGGVQYCERFGISIPEELKIVGYDDSSVCCNLWPHLTTIRQSVDIFGDLAVNTILTLIDGENPEKRFYKIPVKLIRRGTT